MGGVGPTEIRNAGGGAGLGRGPGDEYGSGY